MKLVRGMKVEIILLSVNTQKLMSQKCRNVKTCYCLASKIKNVFRTCLQFARD